MMYEHVGPRYKGSFNNILANSNRRHKQGDMHLKYFSPSPTLPTWIEINKLLPWDSDDTHGIHTFEIDGYCIRCYHIMHEFWVGPRIESSTGENNANQLPLEDVRF